MNKLWVEVRTVGRYVRLVVGNGLTVVRLGVRGVMLVSGLGLAGIVAFVVGIDRFVLTLATAFAAAIIWIVGGYRIWKETDRARTVAAAAAVDAQAARTAGQEATSRNLPFEVEIANQIKQGRRLIEAMIEPFTGRFQSVQVDPWTAQVTQILSARDPTLARRFVESDDGVAPWNPMVLSPEKHITVMKSRVQFLEGLLADG